MKISIETVKAAFEQHYQRYANARRGWTVEYHVKCWKYAQRAFGEGLKRDFEQLYEELRTRWQAFRPYSNWGREQIWTELRASDRLFAQLRLSEHREADLERLWPLLQHMGEIKVLTDGPSVVALSKVLHFWNPRLFVIVDTDVMWKVVLKHWWLWDSVEKTRDAVRKRTGYDRPFGDIRCDLCSYAAILLWAGELVRDNPIVCEEFAQYVHSRVGPDARSLPLDEYEGAAAEWFLQGLVEVPPPGVTF